MKSCFDLARSRSDGSSVDAAMSLCEEEEEDDSIYWETQIHGDEWWGRCDFRDMEKTRDFDCGMMRNWQQPGWKWEKKYIRFLQ